MTTPEATSSSASFAALVDHTLLKPTATRGDVIKLAHQGIDLGVASVCINPIWVAVVAQELRGSPVKTCCVAGFPLGSSYADITAREARAAIDSGAAEIDMVAPLGWVKSGMWDEVETYVRAVRQATSGAVLKVIVETAALTDAEVVRTATISANEGADFVKTSTGFHPEGGATTHAVELLRSTVPDDVGVKASGGIRSLDQAQAMLEAGATRLGLSSTAAIIREIPA